MATLTLRILGCGSSGGVPRVGSGWGACDPNEPRNRRRRCSILVARDGEGGRIDDLRPLVIRMRARIRVHADAYTRALLNVRFGYCFETPEGSEYPPILDLHDLPHEGRVAVQGPGGAIEAEPLPVEHGNEPALGFRFGRAAYVPDVSLIPPRSLEHLRDLDLLIVDALRHTPHPTHFSVSDALALIAEVKPGRAVLTNLHTDLDYATLAARLPEGIEPAYDGMVLTLPA